MADYQYIATTGTIVPDTADILTTIENEYKGALGSDLIVDPSTPQGVLISAEAIARDAVVRNNAALANQINPNIAGGVFLDAIMALTGSARTAATRSYVRDATLSGVSGTIVPAGSQARTVDGDLFETMAQVTIGSGGSITVDFQSMEFGPIPCPVGKLTSVVSAVLGWEQVINPTEAEIGAAEQSDVAARRLRRNTLAAQGVGLVEAITSGLYLVDGVKSLTLRENYSASSVTVDGRTLVPHSIRACVDGGTDLDVATTLLDRKSLGCNWNGTTTVSVTEPSSGQVYSVTFDRPTEVPVKCQVSVKANSMIINPITAVKEAILNYADGLQEGEGGLTVGEPVSPFEIAGAVQRIYPSVYCADVKVAKVGDTLSNSPVPITLWEKAVLTEGNIEVIVL